LSFLLLGALNCLLFLSLDAAKIAVEPDDESDAEGAPQISLMEMLEDLHISEDATGEEGAPMME
jgi:nonsense-mediated mRNA decay protein 3